MTWTHFMDMHSGGGQKEEWAHIYIEAPETEARVIFYNRFGHSPDRVTCTCCGEDYSISEHESLQQLTGYERRCACLITPRDPVTGRFRNDDPVLRAHYYVEEGEEPPEGYEIDTWWRFGKYQTLDAYMAREDVKCLPASEIDPTWRIGEVPVQGYVYM